MRSLVTLMIFAGLAAGQPWYPHHNFTFGVGGAQPAGQLTGFFQSRPGISIGYGYRFMRYFQADAGLETVFGAGHVKDFLETPVGYSRIRDYQFLVPLGGRAILPFFREKLQFSAGAGAAYMRYAELLKQPSYYYQVDCPVCGSRGGWGYYGLAGFNVFLDRYRHWRVGVSSRVYRGHTQGDPVGPLPAVRTRDHWVNTYGEFGVSF